MSPSLRRRLLIILSATVLAAWMATALFSYFDTRRMIDGMLDANLARTAELILALSPAETAGGEGPSPDGGPTVAHPKIAFLVWSGSGALIQKSPNAPDLGFAAGYGDADYTGEKWRVFGARAKDGEMRVLVASPYRFRQELSINVAGHIMHPLPFALPLLAVLIWLAVGWALAPLHGLARQVAAREPGNLAPLGVGGTPAEARPLVDALNSLFGRVTRLVERERRFTADAAHELRTPLAVIKTNSQVAQEARSDEERRTALRNVLHGTDAAARLVDQLLTLARLEPESSAPPAGPVDLYALAAETVAAMAGDAAARGVDLGLAASAAAVPSQVSGSRDLLAIMLRNLVENAISHIPGGSRVDVAVRAAGQGGAVLAVADNGPGIPEAERKRVFDRFFRGSGAGPEGSGLGLSIVARIAELHHAQIRLLAGLEGHGLAIEVEFPGTGRA